MQALECAVVQLGGPVTAVVVVAKQHRWAECGLTSPSAGPGGFQLGQESNLPLAEVRGVQGVVAGLGTTTHFVLTNWSRQFARSQERRAGGVTEEAVVAKVQAEFARAIGVHEVGTGLCQG